MLASWQPVPSLIRFVHVDITESRRRIRGNLALLSLSLPPSSLRSPLPFKSRIEFDILFDSSLPSPPLLLPSCLYLFSRLLGFVA